MVKVIFSEEFEEKVLRSEKPVLVDFFADWCGPCKMLAPVLESVVPDYPDVEFFKINIDQNTDLAERFAVMSIPTVFIFKNGAAVDKFMGFRTEPEIRSFIEGNR